MKHLRMLSTARGTWLAVVASMGCMLLTPVAHAAWDFIPTATEWQAWPPYCRVQYSWVNAGFEFDYGGTVPQDIVDQWKRTVGPENFVHLHHYCASIHFLTRARVETNPQQHSFLLNRAWTDGMYTFSRMDPQTVVYPPMAVTVAQIAMEMGKPSEAEQILRKSMLAQPTRPEPYVMMAVLDRKEKKLTEARDVLKQADDATHGESSEIQYNLGLINLEIGDTAAALANAKKAYGHGYPLPGLKNKLRKAGKWTDADDAAAEAMQSAADAAAPTAPATTAPSAPATTAASEH